MVAEATDISLERLSSSDQAASATTTSFLDEYFGHNRRLQYVGQLGWEKRDSPNKSAENRDTPKYVFEMSPSRCL